MEEIKEYETPLPQPKGKIWNYCKQQKYFFWALLFGFLVIAWALIYWQEAVTFTNFDLTAFRNACEDGSITNGIWTLQGGAVFECKGGIFNQTSIPKNNQDQLVKVIKNIQLEGGDLV